MAKHKIVLLSFNHVRFTSKPTSLFTSGFQEFPTKLRFDITQPELAPIWKMKVRVHSDVGVTVQRAAVSDNVSGSDAHASVGCSNMLR